jgi:hypothetical protein
MKFKFLTPVIILGIALLINFASCKKETVLKETVTPTAPTTNEDLISMLDQTDKKYLEVEVTEGNEVQEFSSPNEGIVESYLLVEQDMDDAGYKRTVERRFISCIKKLDLTDAQVASLRLTLRQFEECKAADVKKHREAYELLRKRIEKIRQEALAKLKRGDITKAQFEEKMQLLKKDFVESLRKIKMSYASNLRMCYEKFLRGIKATLTDRQWRAFMECYRS